MATYNKSSRYFNCDTTNDLPQDNLLKKQYSYDNIVVQANECGRLDLVSYRVYSTPVNWWIIARFNNIFTPEQVQVGDVLKIPRL